MDGSAVNFPVVFEDIYDYSIEHDSYSLDGDQSELTVEKQQLFDTSRCHNKQTLKDTTIVAKLSQCYNVDEWESRKIHAIVDSTDHYNCGSLNRPTANETAIVGHTNFIENLTMHIPENANISLKADVNGGVPVTERGRGCASVLRPPNRDLGAADPSSIYQEPTDMLDKPLIGRRYFGDTGLEFERPNCKAEQRVTHGAIESRDCDQHLTDGAVESRDCDLRLTDSAVKSRDCDQRLTDGTVESRDCELRLTDGTVESRDCDQRLTDGTVESQDCELHLTDGAVKSQDCDQRFVPRSNLNNDAITLDRDSDWRTTSGNKSVTLLALATSDIYVDELSSTSSAVDSSRSIASKTRQCAHTGPEPLSGCSSDSLAKCTEGSATIIVNGAVDGDSSSLATLANDEVGVLATNEDFETKVDGTLVNYMDLSESSFGHREGVFNCANGVDGTGQFSALQDTEQVPPHNGLTFSKSNPRDSFEMFLKSFQKKRYMSRNLMKESKKQETIVLTNYRALVGDEDSSAILPVSSSLPSITPSSWSKQSTTTFFMESKSNLSLPDMVESLERQIPTLSQSEPSTIYPDTELFFPSISNEGDCKYVSMGISQLSGAMDLCRCPGHTDPVKLSGLSKLMKIPSKIGISQKRLSTFNCGGCFPSRGETSDSGESSTAEDMSSVDLLKEERNTTDIEGIHMRLLTDLLDYSVKEDIPPSIPYLSYPCYDDPTHVVVCVHGLDGNSADLRLVRSYIELSLNGVSIDFLMSEVNQSDTFADFEVLTKSLVREILQYVAIAKPTRLSFIGHSLGNILIRSALSEQAMQPLLGRLHTFLSLSGPHLGTAYNSSNLVNAGMWLMQKWKKSGSLLQLSMKDHQDPRKTFLYRLSMQPQMALFSNLVLVGSCQDRYVPLHSALIQPCRSACKDTSNFGVAYRQMIQNLLSPVAKSGQSLRFVRYDALHSTSGVASALLGRAAHVAVLDSEVFLEKFILVSGLQYFK